MRNITFIIAFFFGVLVSMPSLANKPMTDDEIKDLILKGEMKKFNRGECSRADQEVEETPDLQSRQFMKGTENGYPKTSESISENLTKKIPKCACMCPFQKDIDGNECGDMSLYFKWKDEGYTEQPKCYPQDIHDWEVNDFRSAGEIPDPSKPQFQIK